MAKGAHTKDEPVRFEDALGELEATVQRLESGDLPLEESLAAFERGVALVRLLNEKLAEVERRVEVLMRDEDGTPRVRALEPEPE
jgi:exodeoxyribonuclease VII small subunit